jgi:LuxR family maltose regulon positive regulatory protein
VAWLSLDILDGDPLTFWSHFLRAVRRVLPDIDDETDAVLAERPHDDAVVRVLLAAVERSAGRGTIVLDDLSRLTDRAVLAALELLVERVGTRLRLVGTARSTPPFPIPRWRSAGWLVELGAADLRFTPEETAAIAAAATPGGLPVRDVRAVADRFEGWPLLVHLSLAAAGAADRDATVADATVDRSWPDSVEEPGERLVRELLDQLDPATAEVAMQLATLRWFDADLAHDLVGPSVGEQVDTLRRHGLLLHAVVDRPGAVRFHDLVRELLDREFRWRDPDRRRATHRHAAELWRERGDVAAAFRHLQEAGDVSAATDLVLAPVLAHVDRGDRPGASRLLHALPRDLEVDDPSFALDLATAWFFAGNSRLARQWQTRADELVGERAPEAPRRRPLPVGIEHRRTAMRAVFALMGGDLAECVELIDETDLLGGPDPDGGPVDRWFATIALRTLLFLDDVPAAARWIARDRPTDGSVVGTVTMPALEAWFDLRRGRFPGVLGRLDEVLARIEELGLRPHHGAFDALVTAAEAHLLAGAAARADELAGAARLDADLLGEPWNHVRAGLVAASARSVLEDATAARSLLHDLRQQLGPRRTVFLDAVDVHEARLLVAVERHAEALDLVAALPSTPRVRLVHAASRWAHGRTADGVDLSDASSWPWALRLEAAALAAVAGPPPPGILPLEEALRVAAEVGVIGPFLGRGQAVEQRLLHEPLESVHPMLADWLRRPRRGSGPAQPALVEPLTPRERTVLELLPSHLSYAQIGDRLYLSVNTVKSNLKSIYRKLGVATRSDAVAVARASELL